jgi:hypothetical protein
MLAFYNDLFFLCLEKLTIYQKIIFKITFSK